MATFQGTQIFPPSGMFNQSEIITSYPAAQLGQVSPAIPAFNQASIITVYLGTQSPIRPISAPTGGDTYRMRAFDSGLGRIVYWNSEVIDDTGGDYAGPGPLVDIVVHMLIGS